MVLLQSPIFLNSCQIFKLRYKTVAVAVEYWEEEGKVMLQTSK